MNRAAFLDSICRHLYNEQARLLRSNFAAVERDPVTVAAVAALVHLKDKFAWGVLPDGCWSEVMGAYAAQVACAVSGDYRRMAEYRGMLAPTRNRQDNGAFLELACRPFAAGYADKWRDRRQKDPSDVGSL